MCGARRRDVFAPCWTKTIRRIEEEWLSAQRAASSAAAAAAMARRVRLFAEDGCSGCVLCRTHSERAQTITDEVRGKGGWTWRSAPATILRFRKQVNDTSRGDFGEGPQATYDALVN